MQRQPMASGATTPEAPIVTVLPRRNPYYGGVEMKRTRWLVGTLVIGVAGIAAFHPLGGEGSAAAEASTGIGVLGLLAFLVLGVVAVVDGRRAKRQSAGSTHERGAPRARPRPL